jgi:hypothetical protein
MKLLKFVEVLTGMIEMKLENGSIVLQLDSGDGCSFLRCHGP